MYFFLVKEEEMVIDGFCCSFPQRPADTVLPPNKNKDLLGEEFSEFIYLFIL